MVVMTTGSSPGAGQFMRLVVHPRSCTFMTALHIGAPDVRFLCCSRSLLLHAGSNLAENHCCLASKITGAGVSPDSRYGHRPQDGSGLSIEEELEVISPSYFLGIPQALAPI